MTLLPSLLVMAAVSGSVDLSARGEVRVRDSGEAVGRAVDLEALPSASVRLRARAWAFEIGYAPRLTLRQLDHEPLPETMHHGLLGASYRFRTGEIALRADGAFGTQSFTSLTPTTTASSAEGPSPIQALPPAATIRFLASRAGLSLRLAPNRRTTLTMRVDYAVSGGADAAAREVVPLQYGPVGALEIERGLTRLDRLLATVAATRATFMPGPDDIVVEAQMGYRRRLDRRAELTLGAGAAALVFRPEGEDLRGRAYPIAEVAFARRFPEARVETRFSARLAPLVSWLNGVVDERIQGNVTAAWVATPAVTVRAQAGAAQSVPLTEDAASTLVLGEAAVTFLASRIVRLELGTRAAWQKQRGADVPPPQWVLFAGVAFTAPTVRF